MNERPFEALGLSADADRVYPLLVATRGVADGELARQLGVSPERARAACAELAARDLVRLGRDGRWYPLPPQTGLLPLVSRAQEQLRRGRELLDRLGVEYQRVHEGHRAEEAVQVVTGQAAIGRLIEQTHASARTELLTFVRACPEAGGVRDPLLYGGSTARVRQRVVLERATLEVPDALRSLAGSAAPPGLPADGAQLRVAGRLPVRMCVADRSVALLPLAADARPPDPVLLAVRPSGLLDALLALFESVWAAGVPVAVPDSGARSALHLRILAMLVSGSTDTAMARSLGIAVRTVQRHVAAMQRDAGVDNRVQLVWHAARHGWLDDTG
jgi:DNA-binding CsgD family transcriptional regulator